VIDNVYAQYPDGLETVEWKYFRDQDKEEIGA